MFSFLRSPGPLFLSAILSAVNASPQACYWSNGTQTDSSILACGSGINQCCRTGSTCLNNGLCFDPGNGIPYRGACTESNWVVTNSSSCPTYCSNWNGGWGWAELNFCGQLGGDRRFWCDDPVTSPNRCAGILYAWPAALGGVAASVGPVLFPETSTLAVSSTFTSTSGSTSATSPTTSPTSSPTSSPTASPTSSPTASALTSPSSDPSLSIAIGAGVGVPLGVLVLGILIYLFTVEKRKRRAADTIMTLPSREYSEGTKQGTWNQPPQEVPTKQEIGGNSIAELPERRL